MTLITVHMKQPLNSLTVSWFKSNLTRAHINDNKLLTTRYLVIACNDHQNKMMHAVSMPSSLSVQ